MPTAHAAFARAYNNWAYDWCATAPQRLYPAALIPIQNPEYAVQEVRRVAKRGFRVVSGAADRRQRPLSQSHLSHAERMAEPHGNLHRLFKTIEEEGLVLGMHTFPAPIGIDRDVQWSPGELVERTALGTGRLVVSSTMSFIFEAMTWLSQILLCGFLDLYPRLKMAIFESNAAWLPELLDHCDVMFKLYRNERKYPARRIPSEAFDEQCMISFESDEVAVYRDWERFEKVGIWASDVYHHDSSDAWTAMRFMQESEVPASASAMLLGENARRFYGIEGRLFVTEQRDLHAPHGSPRRTTSSKNGGTRRRILAAQSLLSSNEENLVPESMLVDSIAGLCHVPGGRL